MDREEGEAEVGKIQDRTQVKAKTTREITKRNGSAHGKMKAKSIQEEGVVHPLPLLAKGKHLAVLLKPVTGTKLLASTQRNSKVAATSMIPTHINRGTTKLRSETITTIPDTFLARIATTDSIIPHRICRQATLLTSRIHP